MGNDDGCRNSTNDCSERSTDVGRNTALDRSLHYWWWQNILGELKWIIAALTLAAIAVVANVPALLLSSSIPLVWFLASLWHMHALTREFQWIDKNVAPEEMQMELIHYAAKTILRLDWLSKEAPSIEFDLLISRSESDELRKMEQTNFVRVAKIQPIDRAIGKQLLIVYDNDNLICGIRIL